MRNNLCQVSVVDCPDLTVWAPGQFPAPGLGGEAKLVEGGGEPFNHDTDYNRCKICSGYYTYSSQ